VRAAHAQGVVVAARDKLDRLAVTRDERDQHDKASHVTGYEPEPRPHRDDALTVWLCAYASRSCRLPRAVEARPLHCRVTMQLGAVADDQGTTFRAWSNEHDRCELRLYDPVGTEPMTRAGGHVFATRIDGVGHGARYRFVLDGTEVGDPYARFLPDGVDGPAMVWRSQHAWRHGHVVRALREHVIYELHVGTFTAEGTYAAAVRELAALVELGVTAIELMPVAAFAGHHGWGDDGVAHYAPHAAYGTPDELRAFPGRWRNAFTGETHEGDRLMLRAVLATFPVAWLCSVLGEDGRSASAR
jgi:hypothetical protein